MSNSAQYCSNKRANLLVSQGGSLPPTYMVCLPSRNPAAPDTNTVCPGSAL
jgi:hypothetical protein